MTRKDYITKYTTTIRTAHNCLLANITAGENRPDLGVMEDVFCNNSRLGRLSRGDDPAIQTAILYAVTGSARLDNEKALAAADAYFALRADEYALIED